MPIWILSFPTAVVTVFVFVSAEDTTAIGLPRESSGVYICKSIVNDLKHGNYICKSEVMYLTYEHRIEIPVEFTYVNQ